MNETNLIPDDVLYYIASQDYETALLMSQAIRRDPEYKNIIKRIEENLPIAYDKNQALDYIMKMQDFKYKDYALRLGREKLTKIPNIVSVTLKYLDLGENKLTSIPYSIGELKSLESLDLGGNRLTSIPTSIGELKSLESLDLGGNRLTSIPTSIGELKNLKSLNIRDNELTSLPESISQLKNLKALNIRRNLFTDIPKSVLKLNLRESLFS